MEIEVILRDCETKEGKKFTAYKGVQANGKLIDISFCKSVRELPTEHCYIEVDPSEVSVDYNRKYPRCYVKKVNEIKPIVVKDVEESDLPF